MPDQTDQQRLTMMFLRGKIDKGTFDSGMAKLAQPQVNMKRIETPSLQQALASGSNIPSGIPGVTNGINATRLGGALAGGATGGVLGAIGGAIRNPQTPGEAAELAVMSGTPIPKGSSRIMAGLKGLLSGAGTSVVGQELKSGIDQGKLTAPNTTETGLSGLLGGIGSAAGQRPAGSLTPEMKKAQAWQEAQAAYKARQLELAKHELDLNAQSRQIDRLAADTPSKVAAKSAADNATQEARKEYKLATKRLADEARRVETYDKGGVAAQQAKYASQIHANSIAQSKAQDALDAASRELKLHKANMSAAEKAAKIDEIAVQQDKVTDLKVRNLKISQKHDPDTGKFLTESDATKKITKNKIDVLNRSNDIGDVRSGYIQDYFEHPEAVLNNQKNLQAAQQQALEDYQVQKEAGQSLRQQKFDHAAQYKGKNGNPVDERFYQAADQKLTEAEQAQANSRAARETHLDHLEAVADAKKQQLNLEDKTDQLKKILLETEPGKAPEIPMSATDKLKLAATQGGIAAITGAAHHYGGPLASGLVGGAAEGLAIPAALKALRTSKTSADIAPITNQPPDYLKQLLIDKLGANAGSAQGAASGVPDLLRQLLSQQQPQEQQ